MRTLRTEEITAGRLVLSPLQPADAAEMTAVLADERLYEFIGGRPPSAAELTDRYLRLAAGSARPGQIWLNWIVRLRDTRQPVGAVQATVQSNARTAAETAGPGAAAVAAAAPLAAPAWAAWIAWVIGARWQGRGYASEAATALVTWLSAQGVIAINAAIHPAHLASAGVARHAGLAPTSAEVDGEQVWSLPGA